MDSFTFVELTLVRGHSSFAGTCSQNRLTAAVHRFSSRGRILGRTLLSTEGNMSLAPCFMSSRRVVCVSDSCTSSAT